MTEVSDNSEESAQNKKTKKLFKRTVVAVLLAAASVFIIIWGVLPLAVEVLIISLIGISEFYDLAERKKVRPSRSVGFSAVILLIALAYMGREEYLPALLLGLTIIAMLAYIFGKGFHISSFLDVGVTVLGFLYMGWFFCYIIFIRKIEGQPFYPLGFEIDRGAGFVLLLIFANHFTDIGAFFVGKVLGKHKLAPHISPGKTVEGAIGGLTGAIGGAFLMGSLLQISPEDLLIIGLLCGIFAQVGDLWESVLKRDVNVKDSGSIISGHGGILDRFDSLVFTSPIVYFYIIYFYG